MLRASASSSGSRRAAGYSVALLGAGVLFATGCGGTGRGAQGAAHRGAVARPAAPAPTPTAAGLTGGTASGESASRRPNIVFVLTDDLAWNLVKYMPHVLQMQRDGVTFTNYFVSDSLCCPSRASILSGRFPHDTRVFDNSPPEGGYSVFHERGEERATFATALRGRGYATALMGKYLNGYRPARNGVPPGWSEWDAVGNGYPEYGYQMNSDGRVRAYGYRRRDYLTNVLAARGTAFIERSASEHRPFMLEIATFAPHSPFTPAPGDWREFPGLRAPRTPAFNVVGHDEPAWLSAFTPLRPALIGQIDRKFRRRAQAVQAVDRLIARIKSVLRRWDLSGDTYIVFSSDNGLHMGEHRLLPGKLTAFDTDIRVPLIVTGPGVPAGRGLSEMAENIDLCPTFERIAGAHVPHDVDGRSLLGLLHGAAIASWRTDVLVEHHGRFFARNDPDRPTQGAGNPPSYEALRTPRALYVEYRTGEHEYYDLARDPFELDNVYPRLPAQRAARLHRVLVGIERCHGGPQCWRAQHARI